MHLPRVSIGLPVKNGERYIKEAIDSVLSQSMRDFELIISDNGSVDKTRIICEKYSRKDRRIRYMHSDEDRGAAWNFNNTLSLARGAYFCWIAHDDVWRKDFLRLLVQELDSSSALLAYPPAILIDEQSHQFAEYTDEMDLRDTRPSVRFRKYLRVIGRHHQCNAVFGLFRTDALRSTKMIAPYVASDRVLLGEVALKGEIHMIEPALFCLREHAFDSTHANVTQEELMAWFDPKERGVLITTAWTHLREYVKAIRALDSLSERIRCRFFLLGWTIRNSRLLLRCFVKTILWPVLKAKT